MFTVVKIIILIKMCGNLKVSTIILIMFSAITILAIAAVMTIYALHI